MSEAQTNHTSLLSVLGETAADWEGWYAGNLLIGGHNIALIYKEGDTRIVMVDKAGNFLIEKVEPGNLNAQ